MLKKIHILIITIAFLFSTIFILGLPPNPAYADTTNNNPFSTMDKARNEIKNIAKEKPNKETTYQKQLANKENKQKDKELLEASGKQYLVKFNDDVTLQQIYDIISTYKYKLLGGSEQRTFTLKIPDIEEFQQQTSGLLEYIEEDKKIKTQAIPSDTYYNEQWGLEAINIQPAWDIAKGSNSVYVAVIDSGINTDNPDLAGADIRAGWDYIFNDTCNWDSTGHGTNVTGIIGAQTNNNEGIAGINWNVAIIPLRTFYSDGSAYQSGMIQAIYDAADIGCDVINLSCGGPYYSSAENTAIQYAISKGCIVVASAGNGGNSTYSYPASYNGVISVGSIDSDFTCSDFSQYNNKVDVTAPGRDILTTTDWYIDYYDYGYATGTSFSAPHVSGIAALMSACKPDLTAVEFENALKISCTDLGASGYDNYYGYGLVDAEKMLNYIMAPQAPTGLNIQAVSDKNITLGWTANQDFDLDSYQLEYKNITSSTWSTVNINKLLTSYTVTNLINGSTYQFRMRTKDKGGNLSPYSDTVSGIPIDNIAPNTPLGLKVSSVNDKQVTLSWNTVSATDLDGYQLEYKGADDIIWTEVSVGKILSYSVTGLTNGEQYSFRIKARDTSNNFSAASGIVTGTPADKTAPVVPTGLKANLGVDKDITLTWNANTEADLAGYEIAYLKYGTSIWVTRTVDAGTASTTIDGLVQNVSYSFKIRAKDGSSNWSAYSSIVKAVPKDLLPPAQPENFTSQPSDKSMILSWTANSEADLAGYQLEYKLAAVTTWSIASSSLTGTTTTYKRTNLINGIAYQFRLKAKDKAGNWSAYSEVTTAIPVDNLAPNIPAGFKVSSVNDKQVTLSWSAVSAADLSGYQIEYKGADDETWTEVSIGKIISYSVTGLTNGETYSFQIKSRDTSNNLSAASGIVTGIPIDKKAPAIPSGLKATIGVDKDVTLTWNANTEADLAGYEIAYLKYGTSTWVIRNVDAVTTSTTIDGLVQNVSYSFKIRAKDELSNWSAYSTIVKAVPKDLIAPVKPEGLAIQTGDRLLIISWTANNETDLAGYQLEYKLATASTWSIAGSSLSASTTAYSKTGLINGNTYQFRLKARDKAGNWSGYSNIVSGVPGNIQ